MYRSEQSIDGSRDPNFGAEIRVGRKKKTCCRLSTMSWDLGDDGFCDWSIFHLHYRAEGAFSMRWLHVLGILGRVLVTTEWDCFRNSTLVLVSSIGLGVADS